MNHNHINKCYINIFFRSSAYFEGDGNRRGYTFEDPGDLDLLIDEKMKEESDKEIFSKALACIKRATTKK